MSSATTARFAPPERAQEVSDGIFAWIQPDGSWWINNTGFLVSSTGVVSIDSCSTVDRTRAYLRSIAFVTDLPVRTLVNTHHHGDHTFGNHLFTTATVVGHENCDRRCRRGAYPAPSLSGRPSTGARSGWLRPP